MERDPAHPTPPKVFGLGLSRTGTMSLGEALEVLGFRTEHYPTDHTTLAELKEGTGTLSILDRIDAIVDITPIPIYRELSSRYPDSLFILTTRNEADWLRSVETHFARLESHWDAFPANFRNSTRFLVEAVYGTDRFEADHFRRVRRRHHDEVAAWFADHPDRLLQIDLTADADWAPLCGFLGRSVPAGPFPHSNRSKRDTTAAWAERLGAARQTLSALGADGEPLVLVDDDRFAPDFLDDLRARPFLVQNGRSAGRPANASAAIAELERIRGEGVRWLAFAWPAFWWLEHYDSFATVLDRTWKRTDTPELVVFDLAERLPGPD